MDIYAYNEKTGATKRLTTARGYDAEGSYSPDGQWLAFTSMRDAYNRPLNDQEKKRSTRTRATSPRSTSCGLTVGSAAADERHRLRRRAVFHARRLAHHLAPVRRAGADRRHLDHEARWQRSEADHRLRIDELGALHAPLRRVHHLRVEQARVRKLRAVHGGRAGTKEPVRVTYSDGFDGLPVPSPDGKTLALTSSRSAAPRASCFSPSGTTRRRSRRSATRR